MQKSSGKYVWLQPTAATTPILTLGDQTANVGPFALAIARQPNLTLPAKYVLASTELLTAGDLLTIWADVTGKKAEYVEISLEDFDRLWPQWGQEMGIMLKFWEEAGDKSWSVEGEKLLTKEDLGIDATKLVGIKEALASFDWSDL
jgi:NmrA-like family